MFIQQTQGIRGKVSRSIGDATFLENNPETTTYRGQIIANNRYYINHNM